MSQDKRYQVEFRAECHNYEWRPDGYPTSLAKAQGRVRYLRALKYDLRIVDLATGDVVK